MPTHTHTSAPAWRLTASVTHRASVVLPDPGIPESPTKKRLGVSRLGQCVDLRLSPAQHAACEGIDLRLHDAICYDT